MSPGIWQIVLLVIVVLVFFGPKRIPGLGKSLGEAIRGFKKGLSDDTIDVTETSKNEQISKNESQNASKETEKDKDKDKV